MEVSIIEVRDVSLAFDGVPVLSGLTFDIQRGEFFCITGRAGSGQTLVLKLCAELLKPTTGEIRRNFLPAGKGSHLMTAGFVFEYGGLLSNQTVSQNVALPLRYHTWLKEEEIAAKVREALARVHITELADVPPARLSLGTRKLVSLARAIAMRPQIIYYDEPMLGLDRESAEIVESIMCEVHAQGTTSVVVSHDANFVCRIADRALVLGRGMALDIGDVASLAASQHPDVRSFFGR